MPSAKRQPSLGYHVISKTRLSAHAQNFGHEACLVFGVREVQSFSSALGKEWKTLWVSNRSRPHTHTNFANAPHMHHRLVLYVVGVLGFALLVKDLGYKRFVDENALMPGLVKREFSNDGLALKLAEDFSSQ